MRGPGRLGGGRQRRVATLVDVDATETKNNPAQSARSHPAPAHPPLPAWAPPVCAVLFGVAVALQAPTDDKPGLAAPLIGLVLALGAHALLRRIRARQGVPRRNSTPWAGVTTAAVVPALHYYALNSTADLRWVYITLGVAAAGIIWYRLRKGPRP